MRSITALGALALLAACPSDDKNAPTLFLAPDGSEVRVHLIEEEPEPW